MPMARSLCSYLLGRDDRDGSPSSRPPLPVLLPRAVCEGEREVEACCWGCRPDRRAQVSTNKALLILQRASVPARHFLTHQEICDSLRAVKCSTRAVAGPKELRCA